MASSRVVRLRMALEWLEYIAVLLEMVGTPIRLPCVPQTTDWSLTDEAIVVRNGPIHRTIPLKYVESIRPIRISHPSGKSNAGRFCVSYRCRPRVTEALEISADDADEFLRGLESHCDWLVAERGGLVRKEPLPTPTYLAPPKRTYSDEPCSRPTKAGCVFSSQRDAGFVLARVAVLCLVVVALLIPLFNQISGASPFVGMALCTLFGSAGYALWRLCSVSHELNEYGSIHSLAKSALVIRFGKRDQTILIGQIDEIYPEDTGQARSPTVSHPDFRWSRNGLRVNYWDDACRELLSVYVVPHSREEFLTTLQPLAPHLARRGDVLFRTSGEE